MRPWGTPGMRGNLLNKWFRTPEMGEGCFWVSASGHYVLGMSV